MRIAVNRRTFLRRAGALGAGVGLAGLGGAGLIAGEVAQGAPDAEKLGWRLGCAAYSFNRLTFYETIDKVAGLGLRWIEIFDWQRLSNQRPDLQTNESMTADDRKEAKKRLADAGVGLASCYCRALAEKDACHKRFDFAKEMGIDTLVAEPPFEAYDMIEKLCDEYQVNLAVHNHPAPSNYWNPDTLLKVSKGRSSRIGACCDTGHWVRSGIRPVDALRKLQGRIISFHLKDIDSFGKVEAECVPWGTGAGQIEGILKEARRQGFKGLFAIEYEPYSPDNLPKIAQCVAYFDEVAAALAGERL